MHVTFNYSGNEQNFKNKGRPKENKIIEVKIKVKGRFNV